MCDWICPQCGSDYHSGCDIGMKTLMYFKPIYKNGVNINPDMNTSTFNIKCHSCKTSFVACVQNGVRFSFNERLKEIENKIGS